MGTSNETHSCDMFGQNVCPFHSFGGRLHQQNKCVLSCRDQHQTMVSICQFVLPPTECRQDEECAVHTGCVSGMLVRSGQVANPQKRC